MAYPDYKKDLLDSDVDVNFILDRYFHSGQPAVFIGAPPDEEANLKRAIARELYSAFKTRIHPIQLVICGSAHLGFSPVPDKLGNPFDATKSDIDISVISPELFDSWWSELQASGLDESIRAAVSRDLFWGFINPANVRDIPDHGTRWWMAFGTIKTDRAAGVRGRLFRSFWSMQSYHRLAVFRGREKLFGEYTS